MLLTDETLEIMADYFRLDGQEKIVFVEEIRSEQMSMIIKSFLVYYETHKSARELEYLDILARGIDREPDRYLLKFRDLFTAEAENNPELMVFLSKRMADFIAMLIRNFGQGKDKALIRKLVESIFFSLSVAPKSGDIRDALAQTNPASNSQTEVMDVDATRDLDPDTDIT